MNTRFAAALIFTLLFAIPAFSYANGVVSNLLGESLKRTILEINGTKVTIEGLTLGRQQALRITSEEGLEQLLVQSEAGKWVPVHKARYRIFDGILRLAKTLTIFGVGGAVGAYSLYYSGEDDGAGKRRVPTVAEMLKNLIALIPSVAPEGAGSDSDK